MTAGRWVIAAAAAGALAAGPARADSVALDLARKAYDAGTWAGAQEDLVRARMAELERRADEVLLLSELYLATDPIEAAQVEASATVGGGLDVSRAAAEASAQLTAHLDSATCRSLWASLLVHGRTATSLDDRARGSGEAAAGACFPDGIDLKGMFDLPAPLTAFPLRAEAHAALSKTPALAAARCALREPYSEIGWRVATEGARYLYGKDRRRWIALAGVSIAENWQWLGFPTGDAARLEVVLDMWFLRLHRRRPPGALADRSIDVFGFGAHGVRDDNGAAVIDFWPLRITGVGLGTDRALLDAAIGFSGVGLLSANDEVVPTTGLPEVDATTAHLALHVGDPRRSLSIGYDRRLDTNLLAELALEDRGWVAGRHGEGRLRGGATAFGSRATHYLDADTRGQERLIGATLDGSYALRDDVALGVAIDATRSLARDAALDGRVAEDGVRALVTVTITQTLYQGELIPVRSLRPDVLPRPSDPDEPAPPPSAPPPAPAVQPPPPAPPPAPPPQGGAPPLPAPK